MDLSHIHRDEIITYFIQYCNRVSRWTASKTLLQRSIKIALSVTRISIVCLNEHLVILAFTCIAHRKSNNANEKALRRRLQFAFLSYSSIVFSFGVHCYEYISIIHDSCTTYECFPWKWDWLCRIVHSLQSKYTKWQVNRKRIHRSQIHTIWIFFDLCIQDA